jgi:heterodisulfide reductase subunit A-like polyferredoxin
MTAGNTTSKLPKLQTNITTAVLVVGVGVTGITAAYLVKRPDRQSH